MKRCRAPITVRWSWLSGKTGQSFCIRSCDIGPPAYAVKSGYPSRECQKGRKIDILEKCIRFSNGLLLDPPYWYNLPRNYDLEAE
jgi:hypothetical protein